MGDQGGSQDGQAGFEFLGRLAEVDRGPCEGHHPAGVDPGGHPDHGHAGLGLAGLDRAGHGGGASVGGEDRAVEVDPAHRGDGQQVGREDLAIRGGDDQVGPEVADQGQGLGGVDVLGLLDGDAPGEGGLLDPARDHQLLAALGAVGLGDEPDEVVAGLGEVLEGGQGEILGAEHHDPGHGRVRGQGRPPFAVGRGAIGPRSGGGGGPVGLGELAADRVVVGGKSPRPAPSGSRPRSP